MEVPFDAKSHSKAHRGGVNKGAAKKATLYDGSYWVLPGMLLAGPHPCATASGETAERIGRLLDLGIRLVVNLMEEHEEERYGDAAAPYGDVMDDLARARGLRIRCVRMPVPDAGIPTFSGMREILDALDEAIGRGEPVYVHCFGGRGRAGTVVGCWLVRHGRADTADVFQVLQKLREDDPEWFLPSPENERQRWMVRAWKRGE
jgi:hypothetical protein